MKEFLIVFRRNPATEDAELAPEQMQALWKAWQDWKDNLTARNNFSAAGKRLGTEGKVVNPKKIVTNGPYVELKEAVVGYMFLMANNIDEATELVKGCPNLTMGGTVEVRPIVAENGNN